MIGPTAHEVEDKEDKATSDEGFAEVLGSASKMMPGIDKTDMIAYFAGLRPAAGKDFIIQHEDVVPGFINVAGIQSPGLTAAPAIANMVRDILEEEGVELIVKEDFIAQRQKTEHLFEKSDEEIKALIEQDSEYGDIVCRCEKVSVKEIKDAIERGAVTLDGLSFVRGLRLVGVMVGFVLVGL